MNEAVMIALALALSTPAAGPEVLLTPAQQEQIQSAESAGPASISGHATVRDWTGTTLREGDNGWVCLPDRPDTEGSDPWCIDSTWQVFLGAYMNQTAPEFDQVGIAYMLAGDSPVSNTDPYATEPTGADDWVTGVPGHLMMLVPDPAAFSGMSTDHTNGGPWVMWAGTPYAHIMVPVESYSGGGHMAH